MSPFKFGSVVRPGRIACLNTPRTNRDADAGYTAPHTTDELVGLSRTAAWRVRPRSRHVLNAGILCPRSLAAVDRR